MELFDRFTTNRYKFTNNVSSFKFIDYMITDLSESVEYEVPDEIRFICDMVKNVFSYQRYEPFNPYVFHKCVPSARNVHANEAYIIYRGDVFRYNCKLGIFEYVSYNKMLKYDFRIIVLSEIWRIAKFYGEFGIVLPLLDAGHLLAERKIRLKSINYTCGNLYYSCKEKEDYKITSTSEFSNLIAFEIDFWNPLIHDSKSRHKEVEFNFMRSMNYDSEIKRFKHVSEFLTHEEVYKKQNVINSEDTIEISESSKRRESAHNYIGIFSTVNVLDKHICEDYVMIAKIYPKVLMEFYKKYRIYFLFKIEDKIYRKISIDPLKKEEENIIKIEDVTELLHDYKHFINIESVPVIGYVSFIYDYDISENENIFNAHIGAGEIMQYLSYASTKNDLFMRPLRNFEDEVVSRVLDIKDEKEKLMYSFISGRKNTENFTKYYEV